MNTKELTQLSRKERLAAMEILWESLQHDDAEPQSPEWHQEILLERKKEIENGTARFISLEKLREYRK